jgi:hypothetical protein
MNLDHDPRLQTLFTQAREELVDDDFVARVMAEVDKLRRRTSIAWGFMGVALLTVAALLMSPLTAAVALMTRLLPVSLTDIDNQWVAQALAPVNSVAGIIAIAVLLLFVLLRKLFR